MAQFINIDGTLINLDKVESVSFKDDSLVLDYPVDCDGSGVRTFKGGNARRAYEWLRYECVETFAEEGKFVEGDAIYLPTRHRNAIIFKIEVDKQQLKTTYHYHYVDETEQLNTGWTTAPQYARSFAKLYI